MGCCGNWCRSCCQSLGKFALLWINFVDLACGGAAIGFGVVAPQWTYFVLADHTPFGFDDDVAFCTHLVRDIGVAAIPPSAFYDRPEHGKRLVRFAFCKTDATLEAAVERMGKLRG